VVDTVVHDAVRNPASNVVEVTTVMSERWEASKNV
jgi:hypothetical protein